ncbi:MAG: methylaspartate mutase [Frankiaceae bacterium]
MTANFGDFVAAAAARGELVVQPRMGMREPDVMRRGLCATRAADACTVGTLTLDSYTRVGDHDAVREALASGIPLNGYPIVDHPVEVTRSVLDGVCDAGFPVQVRHGSATPQRIMAALAKAGLHATEGGPLSYCLPYSRVPVSEAVRAWAEACLLLGEVRDHGPRAHLETFGGCMLGQLCPPSLLIAISTLEACFFRQHGIDSVSLSYAQQTHIEQDVEAVVALRSLAATFLPDIDWHVVVYAYMGLFPRTPEGATRLVAEAARLSVRGGAHRLIVKTVAESHRIPTIAENVQALEVAASAAADARRKPAGAPPEDSGVLAAATAIVEAVLELDLDIGRALVGAVRRGLLDIPYCLHPDNLGRTRATVGWDGRLYWTRTGNLPRAAAVEAAIPEDTGSRGLLRALSYVQRCFDALEPVRTPLLAPRPASRTEHTSTDRAKATAP